MCHLSVLDKKSSNNDSEAPLNTKEVLIGIVQANQQFIRPMQHAYKKAKAWRERVGMDVAMKLSSSPVIEVEGPRINQNDDEQHAVEDDGEVGSTGLASRFVKSFSLSDKPESLRLVKADLVRTLPLPGTLAISTHHLIFWRRRFSSLPDTRLKVPLGDLVSAEASRAFRWHSWGIRIQVRGHADLIFDIHNLQQRDLTLSTLRTIIEDRTGMYNASPTLPASTEQRSASPETKSLHDITKIMAKQSSLETAPIDPSFINLMPKVVNITSTDMKAIHPMKVCMLTIGSRGDVQPYIVLGQQLKKHGHFPIVVSHPEYREFVELHGLEFRPAGGDPGVLMALSVEHSFLSSGFWREALSKFRGWLDELLRESWEQCYDADLLIESPSTMAGIHVAEAANCYYFRCFTMPWTKTSAYPQAFSVPPVDMGPSYNSMSYTLFEQIMWRATAGQINRWRKYMLGLEPTNLAWLDQAHVPFIYNFSEAVVPHPLDWGDLSAITGYWFLETSAQHWQPSSDLIAFLQRARADGKKVAYIGFGSITLPDARATTKAVYEAVKRADVRAIVAKGWSDRKTKENANNIKDNARFEDQDIIPPPEVYSVSSIPHDWLFPRIDVALHHGGAGTTGASLRAGLTTCICPFFGDQFFWALRVTKLGAGLRVSGLDTSHLASALHRATTDRIMVEKAQAVGEKIRRENGPGRALEFIYANLANARRTRHPLKVPLNFEQSDSNESSSANQMDLRQLPNKSHTKQELSESGDSPSDLDDEDVFAARSYTPYRIRSRLKRYSGRHISRTLSFGSFISSGDSTIPTHTLPQSAPIDDDTGESKADMWEAGQVEPTRDTSTHSSPPRSAPMGTSSAVEVPGDSSDTGELSTPESHKTEFSSHRRSRSALLSPAGVYRYLPHLPSFRERGKILRNKGSSSSLDDVAVSVETSTEPSVFHSGSEVEGLTAVDAKASGTAVADDVKVKAEAPTTTAAAGKDDTINVIKSSPLLGAVTLREAGNNEANSQTVVENRRKYKQAQAEDMRRARLLQLKRQRQKEEEEERKANEV